MRGCLTTLALLLAAPSLAAHLPHKGGAGAYGPNGNSAAAFNWTLVNNQACQASTLGSNFFVMFGNASGTLITGTQNVTLTPATTYPLYTETTKASIASASKAIFTTYMAQVRGITGTTVNWTAADINHLHQVDEGYTNDPDTCPSGSTIASCLAQTGTNTTGCVASPYGYLATSGGAVCSANRWVFFYSGTHFQIDPVANADGFQSVSLATFNAEFNNALNIPTASYPNGSLRYSNAGLAGNLYGNADALASVLQQIVAGTLNMRYSINQGGNNVCTNFVNNSSIGRNVNIPVESPGKYYAYSITKSGTTYTYPAQKLNGTTVTTSTTLSLGGGVNYISSGQCGALGSPIPENWQYTEGGWILSDPAANGDQAYASPGSFGTVVWIDHTFTYWGVFFEHAPSGSGYAAEQCDRLLRCAYLSGNYQPGTIPTSNCYVPP